MSTTATSLTPAELQRAARDHLWLHFTRMGSYRDGDIPIIVRAQKLLQRHEAISTREAKTLAAMKG